jgi:hypothetical protein
MPFDSSDPRTALAQPTGPPPNEFAEPQVLPFTDDVAEVTNRGTRQWLFRTQHAVVAYADAVAGEVLVGPEDRETLVAVPDGATRLRVAGADSDHVVVAGSVVVIPETKNSIRVLANGLVVRVFPAAGSDLLGRCINASAYEQEAANVASYEPVHVDRKVLTYRLDDYPPSELRFGHIFRSGNLMVNFIAPRDGPRDPRKLSPHSHADFEQCSLQLGGDFVHHVRTPWTPDIGKWRPDQHLQLTGHGAIIFPPPLEHTSQATGAGANRLIDVFAPPRQDFLNMQNWVLNALDYQ